MYNHFTDTLKILTSGKKLQIQFCLRWVLIAPSHTLYRLQNATRIEDTNDCTYEITYSMTRHFLDLSLNLNDWHLMISIITSKWIQPVLSHLNKATACCVSNSPRQERIKSVHIIFSRLVLFSNTWAFFTSCLLFL